MKVQQGDPEDLNGLQRGSQGKGDVMALIENKAIGLIVGSAVEMIVAGSTIEEVGEGSCAGQGLQSITSSEDCKTATRKIHGKNKWITNKSRRALPRNCQIECKFVDLF